MKKILLSIFTIAAMALSTFGQAPEGFKYQAVVRDAGNAILVNRAVGIQLTIQQGSAGGTAVYTETFAPTTNAYGLVNLEIGTGTTLDDFTNIDWANGSYFIETAIDATGGSNYSIMGTSQLMSVPYALYAKTSGNGVGPAGVNGLSTYDLAYSLDSTIGTAQQWLASLTGTDGLDGAPGSDGQDGPIGPQGSNGLSAYNLAFIADSTIGTELQWLASLNGATGAQGPAGNDGAVGAAGPAGANGQDGAVGAVGATGPQGPAGNDGAVGAAGANGQDGAVGATGPQGPIGNDGSDATNYWTESGGNVYRSSGNVGIGTTSPDKKLHIKGDGGDDAAIRIQSTNSSGAGFMYMQRNTDGKSYVLNGSNQALILGANNNTSQLYLKENGNVGIGTTTNIGEKLVVNGNIETLFPAGKIGFDVGDSYNSGNFAHYGLSKVGGTNLVNLAGYYGLSFGTYGSEKMRLTSNGRLGIGTTSPASRLEVTGGEVRFVGTQNTSHFNYSTNEDVYLRPGKSTGKVVIADIGGNVGIGTSSPAEKLHVDGHTKIQDISIGYTNEINSESNLYLQHRNSRNTIICGGGGNLGVDVNSPAFKLHVAGDVMADGGWLRTTGNRGWFSQTYGGGWHMTDNNWIRAYGGKGLYVGGDINYILNGKYFSEYTSGTISYNGNAPVSILASKGIVGDWIGAYSDERIKDIIGRSNSKDDLSDLLAVEVTDYKMKDKVQYGDKVTKKVIAQQLKTVFPQAVSLQTKVIPDIYEVSEIKEGYISLKTDLKKGDRVKLIFEEDEQTGDELVEVLSSDENGFNVDTKKEGKVFVYGKEIDDFHIVDYDAVSMLNVSATQELYKLILKQQKTIEKQKEQIDTQKAQVDLQKAQISAQIEKSKKTQSNFDERIKNLEILFNISKLNE